MLSFNVSEAMAASSQQSPVETHTHTHITLDPGAFAQKLCDTLTAARLMRLFVFPEKLPPYATIKSLHFTSHGVLQR